MTASFVACYGRSAFVTSAALTLAGCGINSVPTAEENAKAKWADVQAAFQERANLIPNLAAVAKGAAEQEKGILIGVVEARAKATSIQLSADDLTDPAKVKAFQDAQNQLSTSMAGFGRLLANVEAYPELKIDHQLPDAAKPARRAGEPHPHCPARLQRGGAEL